jgi:hypothetical protein
MRVLETRRAHMDMRPRARAMMMMMSHPRCRIHGNDRDRDRGAVRARVRGRARGARDASRAMAYRRGCFVSFARAPCGREVSRLVVVVRSARLIDA